METKIRVQEWKVTTPEYYLEIEDLVVETGSLEEVSTPSRGHQDRDGRRRDVLLCVGAKGDF